MFRFRLEFDYDYKVVTLIVASLKMIDQFQHALITDNSYTIRTHGWVNGRIRSFRFLRIFTYTDDWLF